MNINAGKFKVKRTKVWKLSYWGSTVFASLALAAVGIADLRADSKVIEGLMRLGYPSYFATILGLWKLLGSAAIIVPGLPRLKEWAYAGMFFTLTGAAISHAATGDTPVHVLAPLSLLVAVMTSWALQPVRMNNSPRTAKAQHDAALPFAQRFSSPGS